MEFHEPIGPFDNDQETIERLTIFLRSELVRSFWAEPVRQPTGEPVMFVISFHLNGKSEEEIKGIIRSQAIELFKFIRSLGPELDPLPDNFGISYSADCVRGQIGYDAVKQKTIVLFTVLGYPTELVDVSVY